MMFASLRVRNPGKGGKRPTWMSKELTDKLKEKKVHEMWKIDLSIWKEYKSIVRTCKDATRKAKALLELSLANEVKDNKKGFF